MRKNSIKNIRINSEVLKALTVIIRDEVKDPRIHPMTSVTEADVTPDLKYCKVYVSVLGNDEDKKRTMEGLKSSASFIRGCLAHTVNLRNTPELTFILDRSMEYGSRMSKMIDEVIRQDEMRAAERGESTDENQ
ncbi:MAG: 30S ribosome-binding factor RbfA [Lachnospiraceae bacterium]|nr:30S ribosome-binding factor RbfA [Lachnospiraceae bacterium]MBR4587452.1 30S ribosome-binding factor RbfA [Lachnospiraceae bacterium]MCR4927484.1 30S ribosome-binding factor RbfA [Lachnospiraceae bacterium]